MRRIRQRRIRQSTIWRTIFLQDSMPWHLWFNLLSRRPPQGKPKMDYPANKCGRTANDNGPKFIQMKVIA
jgi:hypothetical protein